MHKNPYPQLSTGMVGAALKVCPGLTNKQVYDIYKAMMQEWMAERTDGPQHAKEAVKAFIPRPNKTRSIKG